MSDIIQINHQAENTYEFDLQIEGLETTEVRAWFVIVVKGMELSFACTQDEQHFTCKIPPLPFIEKTAYKGAVRLVADDYFFEVVSDLVVNVIGTLSFERSDVANMTVKSTIDGKTSTITKAETTREPAKTEPKKTVTKKAQPAKDVKKTDEKKVVAKKPEPKDIGKKAEPKKVSEGTTIVTDVKRVESSSEIAARLLEETASEKPKREIPSFNVRPPTKTVSAVSSIINETTKSKTPESSKFVRKGEVTKPEVTKPEVDTKNAIIESEISSFVATKTSERDDKLRNILKNFTVSPEATSQKVKFTKKS